MGFLKRNFFVILCGLAGVTGIGLTVTFIGCMAEIDTRMQEAVTLHSSIESAGRNPQNLPGIQKIEAITKRIQEEQGRVLKLAIEANVREPLRDDVFPKVAEQNIPYRFKTDYKNAFDKMMRQLNPDAPAGMTNFGLPTQDEITSWEIEIDRLSADVERKPDTSRAGALIRAGIQFRDRRQLGQSTTGGAIDDRTPEELAREDPYQMAHLAKARAIHCYVGIKSFQRNNLFYAIRDIREQDMWAAQVLLWIQQDVIKALAAANRRAGEQLAEVNRPLPEDARLPADVATMAVKHVQGIQLTLPEVYEAAGAMGAAGGAGGAQPLAALAGGAAGAGVGLGAFTVTGRSSNDLYDVVPFLVTLVVDQRDLPLIIDEIAQANFFTLLNTNYQMLPPDEERGDGYLYGHEPVVTVSLEFEAYFFRDVYHWRWPEGGPKESAPGLPPDELQTHAFMPDAARAGVTSGMGLDLLLGFSGPEAASAIAGGTRGGFGQGGFGQGRFGRGGSRGGHGGGHENE